ncbi:MAG TPA: RecQ family ATP-dependent DNA helicase [Thermoanaerobaculia bacterium]|nr:RecQ family ATP-dependent DNA helicase [Thermoanaerobaculia bacterium]
MDMKYECGDNSATASEEKNDRLAAIVSQYWGFSTLLPLQREAMLAVLDARDSLVVLPTGGGKSLCYQAPALLGDGLTVVVSPLISLMKDQVDGLIASGVPAGQLNSSLDARSQRDVESDVAEGRTKLLFVSPERVAAASFRRLLASVGVDAFAIDEAHCISHWGHDFRPEYRQLRDLRRLFPGASIHAYTATATTKVRSDIIEQLALREPVVLVGDFDRPNLTYRVVPRRRRELEQIEEVIARHRGEGGIIYCIRRRDVDEITAALRERGHDAVPYHAGLPIEERKEAQEAFTTERCQIVVATVAFGMGIDRSNVRFVLHAGMPKSLEHYQQEAGRAGRDGLDAECVLLYGRSDATTWRKILEQGSSERMSEEQLEVALRHLQEIDLYCTRSVCRHRALVEHFGQNLESPGCRACDVCLGDREVLPDSLVIAQKILSCIVRLRDPFGGNDIASVLRGERLERIRRRGHDTLSTYGILSAHAREEITAWIGQLVGAGLLQQEEGLYPVIRLTALGRQIFRGATDVKLFRSTGEAAVTAGRTWDGVDRDLFEVLRQWRKETADARGAAPFVIFSDATLRQLATARPSTFEGMRQLYGIGLTKLDEFGTEILDLLDQHCSTAGLTRDCALPSPPAVRFRGPRRPSPERDTARAAFRRGVSIDGVMETTGRARSTVVEYLSQYIEEERPSSISRWIPDDRYAAIAGAATKEGVERLKPIRDRLGESVSYDEIRLVLAHLRAGGAE